MTLSRYYKKTKQKERTQTKLSCLKKVKKLLKTLARKRCTEAEMQKTGIYFL